MASTTDEEQSSQLRVPTLAEITQDKIVEEILNHANQKDDAATFAIGGSVLIDDGDSNEIMSHDLKAPRIQLRFDRGKLELPLTPGSDAVNAPALESLLEACSAAVPRCGCANDIDDGSCRAGELNAEEFLSDFCPYSAGIVDTIAQVFSSSVADESSAPTSAILANLTKLSVYTGPSGCSAVHVDMPRGVHQFCSLIVALPVPHVGGELVVKRGDRRVKFDFSEGVAQNVIQWAAFYSDCELEFLTVTSGHHITLTYNLVWKSLIPTKLANLSPSTIDVHDMPLHQILSKSLISPSFFPDGRILAIVMSHNYAHTSKRCFLPQGLRGSDMTLFEICKALNLATYVRLTTDHMIDFMWFVEGWGRPWEEVENDLIPVPDWDCQNRYIDDIQMFPDFKATVLESGAYYRHAIPAAMQEIFCVPEDWEKCGLVQEDKTTWLRRGSADTGERQYVTNQTERKCHELIHLSSFATMFIRIPPFHERGQEEVVVNSNDDIYRGIKPAPRKVKE